MNDDKENEKFLLEHQAKEAIDEEAAKVGLHLQEWQVIDPTEIFRQMGHDGPEAPGLMVQAVFEIGNLAFADHVLNPEKDAEDDLIAMLQGEFDQDEYIDAIRPGGELDQLLKSLEDDGI